MKYLYDFVHELPGITALATFMIGGLCSILVLRRYFPLQNRALDALVKTHEAHESVLEAHSAMLDKERIFYREKTHAMRNEMQGLLSKIAVLEARPNLATMEVILQRQATAMEGIRDTMQTQAKVLEAHMRDDHDAFEKIHQGFEKLLKT